MESPKKAAFADCAHSIIQSLQKRGMRGYYCPDKENCLSTMLSMITPESTISWGGSESIKECGLLEAIKNKNYHLLDRDAAKTPEESKLIYQQSVFADYYFMSSNAITLDGELVNIDGRGNRVACLIYGPEHIFIVVGMNKVVPDVASAIGRVQNIASPANAKRLNRQTPCNHTGKCGNCFSLDCMCNQIVITRHSGQPERIHVFLVGEELGY